MSQIEIRLAISRAPTKIATLEKDCRRDCGDQEDSGCLRRSGGNGLENRKLSRIRIALHPIENVRAVGIEHVWTISFQPAIVFFASCSKTDKRKVKRAGGTRRQASRRN